MFHQMQAVRNCAKLAQVPGLLTDFEGKSSALLCFGLEALALSVVCFSWLCMASRSLEAFCPPQVVESTLQLGLCGRCRSVMSWAVRQKHLAK